MYASVKCRAGCKAGILMRAEKTPDGGMKGILMSVTEDDLVPYLVKIDGSGKEISREALRRPRAARAAVAGGAPARGAARQVECAGAAAAAARPLRQPAAGDSATTRMAAQTAALRRPRRQPGTGAADVAELAAQYPKESRLSARPAGAYMPGDYNAVEVLLSENSVQPKFNGGSLGGGNGRPHSGCRQGRLRADRLLRGRHRRSPDQGLHVQGHPQPHLGADETGKNFRRCASTRTTTRGALPSPISTMTASMDIAAGAFYYLGPDYRVGKQIYTPVSFNPTSEWPIPAMVNLAYDFTGDGWADVLQMAGNAATAPAFCT